MLIISIIFISDLFPLFLRIPLFYCLTACHCQCVFLFSLYPYTWVFFLEERDRIPLRRTDCIAICGEPSAQSPQKSLVSEMPQWHRLNRSVRTDKSDFVLAVKEIFDTNVSNKCKRVSFLFRFRRIIRRIHHI